MNHPDYPAWREWLSNLPAGVPMTAGDYLLTGANSTVNVIQGQLQSDRMVQPFAKAALIDGIRFRAEVSGGGGLVQPYFYNNDLVPSLMARVWVGPFSLTNDFVNVPALAVREQYVQGEVVSNNPGLFSPFGLFLSSLAASGGGFGAQYTWYFREPVYVPAGVPVRVNLKRFFNTTQDSSADAFAPTTSAAVFGRYFTEDIAPPPGPVPIPYGATFLDPTIPESAADQSAVVAQVVSAQTDLCNQTSDTLYLDKMIGRLPMRQLTGGVIPCGDYTGPEPMIRITRTYSAGRDAFSRANNRPIVDPLRPFNSVFAPHSRALDMTGVEMPPGSAFIASVFKATRGAPAAAPFAAPINLRVYPALGLLGARMERWS